jgi:hypothetical protein
MFGLIGLLLGVGLTVWIGSQVFDDTTGGSASTTVTTPSLSSKAAITVEVPPGLDDEGAVQVRGTGFPTGPVQATLCLTHPVESTPDPCDTATDARANVAADGTWELNLVVPRVISVGGEHYDCAAAPGACSVLAHLPDDPDGPTEPISFSTGLGPVDAQAPPTS